MTVVDDRERFLLVLGPTVAPMLIAVVGVEILRGGDLLPLPPLVEVTNIISRSIGSEATRLFEMSSRLSICQSVCPLDTFFGKRDCGYFVIN